MGEFVLAFGIKSGTSFHYGSFGAPGLPFARKQQDMLFLSMRDWV
jgi:hypothetical protein